MNQQQLTGYRIDPLQAIELIATAEPDRLATLAGDLARLILTQADKKRPGTVDSRSWAAVDAARAYERGDLSAEDLDRIAERATAVSRELGARINDAPMVAAAALAAEVARVSAYGDDPDHAALMTRDVFGFTRRTRVPDSQVSALFSEYVSSLQIFDV